MQSIICEIDNVVSALTKFQDVLRVNCPINTHTMQEIKEMNEQASKATLTQAEINCLIGRVK